MRKVLIALLMLAATALAVNVKLYLKDGSYQLVREYRVEADRVRFYSIERSQWEEIPLDLVDLKRTQTEVAERQAVLAKEAKIISEEERAEHAMQDEIGKIPQSPGAYYVEEGAVKSIPAGDVKVHNNKRRGVLKALSPLPVVTGKATLELDGPHSPQVLTNPEQEFYLQLSGEDRFGIIKLTPDRGERVVEKLTIIPVTKDIVEEPVEVETFRKQLTPDGLYKIWPQKPLPPGEYAVMEYTPGKVNMQVYDFSMRP